MRDLHNAGLRGRLPLFIESFLKNRQFHVRLGSSYSDVFDQEMGVPQGSILSVTLFGLKINSIVKAISPGVEYSLYVDQDQENQADQETLLHLYRSLIRSKLDYGCIVYGSARGSYLRMLDPIQNHALRLWLGAYRKYRIQFMRGSK